MSGTIDSAGQVAAINAGSKYTPVINPLQAFTGWQDYANKVAENAQIKANTATTQQTLATTMAKRHAQNAYALSNLPDSALQNGKPIYDLLDQELQSGQLNQQAYTVAKQHLDQITQQGGGQGNSYRPYLNSVLVSTLAGPEAIQAVTGHNVSVNNGAQMSGGMQAGPLSQTPGAITTSGPVYTQLPGPQNINLGNKVLPTSGGQPIAPALTVGTTPEQANLLQTIPDPNNPGHTIIARNSQLGGLVGQGGGIQNGLGAQGAAPQAGAYPPGTTGNGGPQYNGAPVSPTNQPRLHQQSAQSPGGLLSNGPASVSNPAVANASDTYNEFKSVRAAQPQLKTSEQTLLRMNDELKNTQTGPGTDIVQTMRNYVSSVNQILGGKINSNDIAAANRDELAKDINQLASQSGAGAISGGVFDVIAHGNPNMAMNTLANLNVTSILLGQNRQKQLEYLATNDKQTGSDLQRARAQVKNLDPRALAIGTFTPAYRAKILQELQSNPAAMKNFYRSIAVANRYHLYDSDQIPNASVAPAQVPPSNSLQSAPPANSLQSQTVPVGP